MNFNISDWGFLSRMKSGTSIEALGGAELIAGDAYKISNSKYCLADVPHGTVGAAQLYSLFWASSDGAFRRAYFREIEKDDFFIGDPPIQLLPLAGSKTYDKILSGLKNNGARGIVEYASYRLATDGIFVHRAIECEFACYYFRSSSSALLELPYAILWKMQ